MFTPKMGYCYYCVEKSTPSRELWNYEQHAASLGLAKVPVIRFGADNICLKHIHEVEKALKEYKVQ